jgi:hypothetical protein
LIQIAKENCSSFNRVGEPMMQVLAGVLVLTAAFPLSLAWLRNCRTTLWHALLWAWLAWLAWLFVVGGGAIWPGCDGPLSRYVALCLTACAGIAVLGARRPTAAAWNFVVVGLLAVLLLPVAEGFGTPRLNAVYLCFLGATLLVGLLNYLPTPLATGVVSLGVVCALEIAALAKAEFPEWFMLGGRCLLALAPWLVLARLQWRGQAGTEFDRLWLSFRDQYGVVWGLRTREQFNRAAANAGWPITLTWHGLQPTCEGAELDAPVVLETLQVLLKRFTDQRAPAPPPMPAPRIPPEPGGPPESPPPWV